MCGSPAPTITTMETLYCWCAASSTYSVYAPAGRPDTTQ